MNDYDKDSILESLNELYSIVSVMYYDSKKTKEKYLKKLKKLIQRVENDEYEKYMSKEWMDENL